MINGLHLFIFIGAMLIHAMAVDRADHTEALFGCNSFLTKRAKRYVTLTSILSLVSLLFLVTRFV